MEVHHAVGEATFVQQLQVQSEVDGQGSCTPSNHDRRDDQMALIDQACPKGLTGEVWAAHGQVSVS